MALSRKTRSVGTGAFLTACFVLGISAALHAQQSPSLPYHPDATLVEVMDAIIMPAANSLWNAIAVDVTPEGIVEKGPETDEDWATLSASAVELAEASNLIVIPGRAVAAPDVESPEYELSPTQISELMQSHWSDWVAHSEALHRVAQTSILMIDARNAKGLSDAGGDLDAACESCHQQFWYP